MKSATLILALLICAALPAVAEDEVYGPGSVVPQSVVSERGYQSFFECRPISDEIFELMKGKSFKEDSTVAREDLEYVLCLHKDKNGNSIVGEMVLNRKISRKVLSVFKDLYLLSYPIERMRLVDYYGADDEASMRSDNSSGFNFRKITNSDKVSRHSLGLAVDINPLYNPYHKVLKDGTVIVAPVIALPFTDRSRKFDYKIEAGDSCCSLFLKAGFVWGGHWKSCKDYQHFEYPD